MADLLNASWIFTPRNLVIDFEHLSALKNCIFSQTVILLKRTNLVDFFTHGWVHYQHVTFNLIILSIMLHILK